MLKRYGGLKQNSKTIDNDFTVSKFCYFYEPVGIVRISIRFCLVQKRILSSQNTSFFLLYSGLSNYPFSCTKFLSSFWQTMNDWLFTGIILSHKTVNLSQLHIGISFCCVHQTHTCCNKQCSSLPCRVHIFKGLAKSFHYALNTK